MILSNQMFYEKYGRKPSWIVKRYGKYGRKPSWIVKRYGKYRRNQSWIVKWYGKYGRKVSWNVIVSNDSFKSNVFLSMFADFPRLILFC
jgi:hypothetical protein